MTYDEFKDLSYKEMLEAAQRELERRGFDEVHAMILRAQLDEAAKAMAKGICRAEDDRMLAEMQVAPAPTQMVDELFTELFQTGGEV